MLHIVKKIWSPLRKLFAPLVSQAGYRPDRTSHKNHNETSPSLWDKQVNLLRDDRGIPYVYIISSFAWSSERGCMGAWTPWIWKFENCLSLSFKFVKQNLTVVCTLENAYNHPLENAFQIYHFATPYLCLCNNTIVFNIPNHFEPEREQKTSDAWSQRRRLKLQFRLHTPALGSCSLQHKKCTC